MPPRWLGSIPATPNCGPNSTTWCEDLLKCQLDDGYLGTYLPPKYWTEWDVWSHKYDLIGLLTYVRYTGNTAPLAGCRKIGDLLCNTFGDGPGQRDIIEAGEHMGMAPDQRAGAHGVALSADGGKEIWRLLPVYLAGLGASERAAHRVPTAG